MTADCLLAGNSSLLTFDDVDLHRVGPGVAGLTGVVPRVGGGGEGEDQVAPPRYLPPHGWMRVSF